MGAAEFAAIKDGLTGAQYDSVVVIFAVCVVVAALIVNAMR